MYIPKQEWIGNILALVNYLLYFIGALVNKYQITKNIHCIYYLIENILYFFTFTIKIHIESLYGETREQFSHFFLKSCQIL